MSPRHARQIDNVSENLSARRLRESRRRRARSGVVQLEPDPNPLSRESDRVYARRQSRSSLIEEANRKRRLRRTLIASIVIIAAIIVAMFVAVQVFIRSTDSRLALDDASVSEVLAPAKSDEPFYVLCLADFENPTFSYSALHDNAIMLARVDTSAKSIGFASMPSLMFIKDADEQEVEISALMQNGSYSQLIKSVGLFLGVDISHIALTDYTKLKSLVNEVGGVKVDLPQEIDDPMIGNIVLRDGENDLDGNSAMEVVRATNLLGGFEATATNRALFTEALISKVLDSNQVELATVLSDAANYVDTDWKSSDILALADELKPFDQVSFYEATIPCSREESDNGDVVYSYKDSEVEEFMKLFKEGQNPIDASKEDLNSKTSKITIEVRNGAGIDGAAATLGAILENNGYTVKEVGNTNDDTLYPETLVVYTGTGSELAANKVIQDIGAGRVVEGGDFYTSPADVIVIIGTDWTK